MTITPLPSPTATATATYTPLPEPVRQGQVIVIDDLESAEVDLSGWFDRDAEDNKALALRWDLEYLPNVALFHIWAQVDFGDWRYLAQTKDSAYLWRANSPKLAFGFRGGPEFGRCYRFRVYALTRDNGRYAPISTAGSVLLAKDNEFKKAFIVPYSAMANDNLSAFAGLGRFGNGQGLDRDLSGEEKSIAIRWLVPEQDVVEIHIYVRDGRSAGWQYLAKTDMVKGPFLWKRELVGKNLADGPIHSHVYNFRVYAIRSSHDPLAGQVSFYGPYETGWVWHLVN